MDVSAVLQRRLADVDVVRIDTLASKEVTLGCCLLHRAARRLVEPDMAWWGSSGGAEVIVRHAGTGFHVGDDRVEEDDGDDGAFEGVGSL